MGTFFYIDHPAGRWAVLHGAEPGYQYAILSVRGDSAFIQTFLADRFRESAFFNFRHGLLEIELSLYNSAYALDAAFHRAVLVT